MNLDIKKSPHMSLATLEDNKPWVCEVHFVYDQNPNLYFRSKTSTRHSHKFGQEKGQKHILSWNGGEV